ncbi:MAG: DUF4124 domain-containing protein [Granulosicoccus sp.]
MLVKLDAVPAHLRRNKIMAVMLFACSLLLLGVPESADSGIHACRTDDGTTVFQDRPCPQKKVAKRAVEKKAYHPLGIHESWFKRPSDAEERAFCNRRACECGPIERRHEGSLAQAVADALFLDAGWHHFESSYQAWMDTPGNSSKSYDRRKQLIEASCNVMISQQLLRDFADEIAQNLRSDYLSAEEKGFDIPDPCDQGIEQACYYYERVKLHEQVKADARALKIPRETLTASSTQ